MDVRFPYSSTQISEMVQVDKHPRDWSPLKFESMGDSLRCDCHIDRQDGHADPIRLIVRAGRKDVVTSYMASLLLEDGGSEASITMQLRGAGFIEKLSRRDGTKT